MAKLEPGKVYKGTIVRDNEGGVAGWLNKSKEVGKLNDKEPLENFIKRHHEEKGREPPKKVTTPNTFRYDFPHEARTVGDTMYLTKKAEHLKEAHKKEWKK